MPSPAPPASPDATFWQRKLAAFLHDSPTKALDIAGHYARAAAALARAALDGDDFNHSSDHTAAAADRIPFPSRQISCPFDGSAQNPFRHPLDGKHAHTFATPFATVALAEEKEQVTQPADFSFDTPTAAASPDDAARARAEFFAHWRLWQKYAVEKDARFAFIPADTRIPDHTIWTHLAVTAAFETALENNGAGAPALLKFHLGPVQNLIAAARSTRDLWSGSFLISWLMMTGLKKLSELAGPDAVIFPNLHGQPLFDALWKHEIWDKLRAADRARSAWQSLGHSPDALTTPSLPNVFLALVPAAAGAGIARAVENAIRAEWKHIADAVWNFASPSANDTAGDDAIRRARFDAQIDAHWSLSWQLTPFPKTLDDAEKLAGKLPENGGAILKNFRAFRKIFEQQMPAEHRDSRYYAGGADGRKTTLGNIGAAWPLIVALNAWQLDAVRNTNAFAGTRASAAQIRDPQSSISNFKDALNGREEQITDGTGLAAEARELWGGHIEPAGATTLVKRLWHRAYLRKKFPDIFTHDGFFSMPNVVSTADNAGTDSPYFAILALDGDDMGQFVSGAKLPPLLGQLAPPAREYFETKITPPVPAAFPRPLNPGYHLQFSQALSNFALREVPQIIKKHGGKLIYAGGDDVLAMLPATTALDCADDLQRAFAAPFRHTHLLPGATASAGIALCHEKSPLQDAVRAAQSAEKRAKSAFKTAAGAALKYAFAVSVFKRSGEITEWAGRFDTEDPRDTANRRALPAFNAIKQAMDDGVLSSKFPHKLLGLIAPYSSSAAAGAISDLPGFPVREVLLADLATVMDRQRGPNYAKEKAGKISDAIKTYLAAIPENDTAAILRQLTGLLITTAFLARQ
jgi:hypothetical protein